LTAAEQEELVTFAQGKGPQRRRLMKWLRLPEGTELKKLSCKQYEAAIEKLTAAAAQSTAA